jgi:hypothetical protein
MTRKRVSRAQELAAEMDRFLEHCETDGVLPTDYELSNFLAIPVETLWSCYREPEKDPQTAAALRKVTAYREARLLRSMEDDPRRTTGAVFQLKQPKNGGYLDKAPERTGPVAVEIRFRGMGDDPFG